MRPDSSFLKEQRSKHKIFPPYVWSQHTQKIPTRQNPANNIAKAEQLTKLQDV